MSTQLVKFTAPKALTVPPEAADAVKEAFAVNIAGGSVSEFDLPRIKVMSGAALWLIPTLEGEETAQRVEGVIAFYRDTRTYYPSKEAGNVPPQCSSADGLIGRGTPGGECARCPLARWDSAEEGSGQACKQGKQLFFMRGDSMFPEVVSLPPTSVKNARQFFLKLTTQGVPYFHALVALELEKAQNPQGKTYGKAVIKFLRRLTPEEAARAADYHQMCQQFSGRVPTEAAPEKQE
jgi:hypothetical protein